MISSRPAALAIAMLALAATGCVQSPAPQPPMKMGDPDHAMMQSCMAMSHADAMKNSGCTSMMSRMKMSEADMTTMAACHKMSHEDMMKDGRCMSMMKTHSGMMGMKPPG